MFKEVNKTTTQYLLLCEKQPNKWGKYKSFKGIGLYEAQMNLIATRTMEPQKNFILIKQQITNTDVTC